MIRDLQAYQHKSGSV
uniref:Uncharacterized protein n=1 Tax=Anguilla anguilla TaxID=7936 RepID=A0A0E9V751_ANGAN